MKYFHYLGYYLTGFFSRIISFQLSVKMPNISGNELTFLKLPNFRIKSVVESYMSNMCGNKYILDSNFV